MSAGCEVQGCTGKVHGNGLCHWHAQPQNEPDPVLLRKPKEKKRKKPARLKLDTTSPVSVKQRGRPACDECGGRDPRKSYRLEPRNLRPTYSLLCSHCRTKLGYREISYERPYAEITARSIMRGAA